MSTDADSMPAVRSQLTDGVRTVLLDRPPVNALDISTLDELTAAFTSARDDPTTAAVVLTGAGGAFCAGVDTKAFLRGDRASRAVLAASINRMVETLIALPQPVVAAVNGHALGGGFVIAVACDARIAARGPLRLGLTEVQSGVAYPANPRIVLQEKLPPHLIDRLVLRGDVISAAEAHDLGLVDELVDTVDTAVGRADEIARNLTGQPAFTAIKAQFRRQLRDRLAATALSADPVLMHWESAANPDSNTRR